MRRSCRKLGSLVASAALLALCLASLPALAQPTESGAPVPSWRPTPQECALLDDPKARGKMDGLLLSLILACGRQDELGRVGGGEVREVDGRRGPGDPDVQVNDSSGDNVNPSTTQSETSISRNEVTGTYCSGYNDSHSGFVENSFTGFSRSTDGGATWTDLGALPNGSSGDPSIFWRRLDGKFYYVALRSGGLGIWRSDDDCQTFTFVSQIVSGSDDKEIMAIDNEPASPFYGRIYVVWTDFGAGARIYETHSSDAGVTWSAQVALSASGVDVQGAWPAVAPSGDVYVGWVRWNPWVPNGNTTMDIEISRSTDGGATWALVTNPLTGAQHPADSGASGSCGRPALNQNIRYLPSPQLVVGPDGALHVIYSYDPDAYNSGDVVNVYYRKSTDNGTTWLPEVQVNDDATLSDQYFPTLSVGPENIVVATWYDRRLDAANALQDTFKAVSPDGGATWLPNERVSDVSTPIYIDPNLAACYHGDYDQIAQESGFALLQWSDDRNMQNGHNDPDVWFELTPVSNDYLILASPTSQAICAPADAVYTLDLLQFQGFSEPVTLSSSGQPAGTTPAFSDNPVTPPGTSTLTISGTGAAAAGSYSVTVTGNSAPSGIMRDVTVGLDLFDQIPAAPALVSPPDGAVDVFLAPTLEWTAVPQAAIYDVEVATDPGFTDVVWSDSTADTTIVVGAALDPLTEYFWHVRAANACGVGGYSGAFSFTTQDIPPILLVDDDDNSPDVRATYEAALAALVGPTGFDLWDTGNSDNEPSAIDLAPYDLVIWFAGDEFGGAAGPGAAGEAALADWLDNRNGCLFITAQDYHFDRGLTTFMQTYLGAASIANDSGNYAAVSGVAGSIFEGQGPYGLTYPGSDFSDIITPDATALLAMQGDNSNGAAVEKDGGAFRTVFFVYPWEAITDAGDRQTVMQTIFDFCGTRSALIFEDGFESGDTSAWSGSVP